MAVETNPDGAKEELARIELLVTRARTIWLALISFLAFSVLTLVSVRDVDFFSIDSTTQLPILNIAIPTDTFFWSASWIAATLHVYFHLFLLKLWKAIAEAPDEVWGRPLGNLVFPWVVVDWALSKRKDNAVERRPLDLLGTITAGVIVWLATPLALAWFWMRSWPAHDARMSLAIAGGMALTIYTSYRGWLYARSVLGRNASETGDKKPGLLRKSLYDIRDSIRRYYRIVWVSALGLTSLAFTGAHNLPSGTDELLTQIWPTIPLSSANLEEAQIAVRPVDWRDPETAREQFHIEWCRDHGLPLLTCGAYGEGNGQRFREAWCKELGLVECSDWFKMQDQRFEAAWRVERDAYLANVRGPDLRNRDLRNANSSGAFLSGVNLSRARLEGVDLSRAQLEAADLSYARLVGANLSRARLEGADLTGVLLENADLRQALLARANLRHARLLAADLRWAVLRGANLQAAQLEVVELAWAELDEADLRFMLVEGLGLSKAVLEGVDLIQTRLRAVDLTGAKLRSSNLGWGHKPSCSRTSSEFHSS